MSSFLNKLNSLKLDTFKDLKKGGSKPQGPSRPMKVPYTFSAKLVQFPYMHYINNQWVWKYYAIAVVCCIPIFMKLSKMANSPENRQKWKESKKRQAEEH